MYAIRIVKETESRFNLCPADLCEVPSADLSACPVAPASALSVTRVEPPPDAVEAAVKLARAASIDIGGIEYLVSRADGTRYFYDVNATSNFVADAPASSASIPSPPSWTSS